MRSNDPGYAITPKCLADSECDEVVRTLSHRQLPRSRAGARHLTVSSHEAVACSTPRGGVIAMRPLLIHSSSKAQSVEPRRVLHIEYADSLSMGDGVELAVA